MLHVFLIKISGVGERFFRAAASVDRAEHLRTEDGQKSALVEAYGRGVREAVSVGFLETLL